MIRLLDRPPEREDVSWRERAACRGCDPEDWFPSHGDTGAHAFSVCAGCPVREECKAHALAEGEAAGIWGGTGPRDRRRIRREMGERRTTCAYCGVGMVVVMRMGGMPHYCTSAHQLLAKNERHRRVKALLESGRRERARQAALAAEMLDAEELDESEYHATMDELEEAYKWAL